MPKNRIIKTVLETVYKLSETEIGLFCIIKSTKNKILKFRKHVC